MPTKKNKIKIGSRVYIYCDTLVGTKENPLLVPTTGHILKVLDCFEEKGNNFVVVRFSSKKLHIDRKIKIRKKFVWDISRPKIENITFFDKKFT